MTTEIEDLRLVWPADVFEEEAGELLAVGYAGDEDVVRLLFAEAFAGGVGTALVNEACSLLPYRGRWSTRRSEGDLDTWGATETDGLRPHPRPRSEQLLEEVLRRVRAAEVPMFTPRDYWSRRQRPPASRPTLSHNDLRNGFVQLLHDLDGKGYLDLVAGSRCCDAQVDRAAEGTRELTALLGRQVEWPLEEGGGRAVAELNDDEFFDLVEGFFDVVARPRKGWWHEYCGEFDYGQHDRRAGQRVYLWRANELLGRSDVGLRLSMWGPDRGLLVHAVNDDRGELERRSLANISDGAEEARVAHAIVVHRGRIATRADKRDAVRALADVLESRREELRATLGSPDENALFQIINGFDIRHMRRGQQGDYGDEFLDYLYWTLLSTVELMDRVRSRPFASD
ncbi:hypothetical protein [Micropruina sonneratiae]|uniref:hypothetical protein n=1 Tax=Micropruina sonneratiae TaxID=2986940 RepID=UPI00222668DB|nr:hypothetical protein [Micropruina sp. KQZ13P-5]MCW3159592.1 hypothetical protein [Micropruina sp. KQZ13P-5]